jgi:hypothetical protein
MQRLASHLATNASKYRRLSWQQTLAAVTGAGREVE